MAKVKIVKYERDPPLLTSKQLIKFKKILRNTTQVIVRHRICLQTDGHGETSISPYNFVAGGIINLCIICTGYKMLELLLWCRQLGMPENPTRCSLIYTYWGILQFNVYTFISYCRELYMSYQKFPPKKR
jgi:hypothetical protein